jgi:hypothetical protein
MSDELREFFRKVEVTAISNLEVVQNRHFTDENVELYGKKFCSCSFNRCSLIYTGGTVEFGAGCIMENCKPEFSGPARRTVLLLHALGLLGFSPFDEEVKKWP